MIISTWNVNSIKVRIHAVLQYLSEYSPDVLALQETKTLDENFPVSDIEALGYHISFLGQKTYNGVAIISKVKPESIDYNPVNTPFNEARSIAVTINGLTIVNLYVVNGQDLGTDKFKHKMLWFRNLHKYAKSLLSNTKKVILLGDFNIAPTDNDVFDADKTKNQILCSSEERGVLIKLLQLGFHDVFHDFSFPPKTFTWWDYRAGAFQRNIGYRIDLILLSNSLKSKCADYIIDKETRHKSWCLVEPRTSDHAPVRIILK